MTYLKVVKPLTVLKEDKGWKGHYNVVISLVMGELFTEREARRFCIPDRAVQKVELPKSRVCWSFGCRFDIDDCLGGRV